DAIALPLRRCLQLGATGRGEGQRQASDAARKTLRPGSCREGGRPVPGRSRRVFDMRIKRFTAPDMRTALRMVRDEQGPDAVILSTRAGADGAGIEVVAATDYDEALVAQALRAAAPGIEQAAPSPAPAPAARGEGGAAAATPAVPRESLLSRARAVFRIDDAPAPPAQDPTLAELTTTTATTQPARAGRAPVP